MGMDKQYFINKIFTHYTCYWLKRKVKLTYTTIHGHDEKKDGTGLSSMRKPPTPTENQQKNQSDKFTTQKCHQNVW